MNRTLKLLVATLGLALLALPASSPARQPTYYQHLTDVECIYDNGGGWGIGWWVFWTPDTMTGPVRSNDVILIKYRPTFLDRVTSSGQVFRLTSGGPGPNLRYPPFFNAPIFPIPEDLPHLRERATETYDSDNGRFITTIVFNNRQGANVYQRRLGIIADDALIATLSPDDPHIVWVDGAVDVKGIVFGQYTIFADGPIGLLDDLLYPEASDRNASFDERRTTSMIGLVSMGDILVRNTIANGRHHEENDNDFAHHSIMVNGALVALNGSFTIDEPNRRGNGGYPYMRGSVFSKGSVVQQTRGALKWNGEVNTGYYWNKNYDERLRNSGPPGLDPSDYPIIREDYDRLNLKPYEFDVYASQMRSLIMREGGSLRFKPDAIIDVKDSLVLRGEPDRPLEITVENGGGRIMLSNPLGYVSLENVRIGEGITLEITAPMCTISGCDIRDRVSVDGSLEVRSSRIGSLVRVTSASRVLLDHAVLEDGVTISANSDDVLLSHCTIAGSNAIGVRLRGNCRATIVNSIVAFNGQGVVAEGNAEVDIKYSDVFGNAREDLVGLELGTGSISIDPQFVDIQTGDLRLSAGSPCIDAGDPDSPRDPDGTRADIGSFWFDQGLGNDDDDDFPPCSQEGNRRGGLSASPNPFNASTVIRFKDGYGAPSSLRIYDLRGREVYSSATPLRVAEKATADHRGSAEEGGGGYGAPSSLRIYDLRGREVPSSATPLRVAEKLSSATPLRVAEKATADHRGSAEEGGGGYGAPSSLRIYDLRGREVPSSATPLRVAEKATADHRGSAEESSFTWNASAFPAGIYIVRYANGRETHSLKLVKVD